MSLKLLALDTATEACSAAVWLDGRVHAHFEIAGREHTQRLLTVVAGVLAEAGIGYRDLDGLVCGVGPGSFAGVRIAVAFAKGVALARALPVVGVTSLALLAERALAAPDADPVLVAIDARMGEVYFQPFERGAAGAVVPLAEPVVIAPERVQMPRRAHWQAVGTGWGAYEAVLRSRTDGLISTVDGGALPQASAAFASALIPFATGAAPQADGLQPLYLRNRVALTLLEQKRAPRS